MGDLDVDGEVLIGDLNGVYTAFNSNAIGRKRVDIIDSCRTKTKENLLNPKEKEEKNSVLP